MSKTISEIKEIARNTIKTEAEIVSKLASYVDDDFAGCVELIYQSKARVVITGVGKSALIAGKIVATLNSTGTPAIFMHAGDAVHGDLGIIQKDDIIICISNSGNTAEIKVLIPFIKMSGNKLIAMVGNRDSYLARQADFIIETTIEKEACPNNLAPTSSTTAQIVMGDALAVSLLECRGFTTSDFAKYHPGGALGKRLYLRVADLYTLNERPVVTINQDISSTIIEISSKRLGATAVMDGEKLVGMITDGDLRRMIQSGKLFEQVNAGDIMSKNPKTIESESLVVHALEMMRANNITQLLVTDNGEYKGVIHLHDILKEGIL
jgi:arabinose-5-phosphate isomerase